MVSSGPACPPVYSWFCLGNWEKKIVTSGEHNSIQQSERITLNMILFVKPKIPGFEKENPWNGYTDL